MDQRCQIVADIGGTNARFALVDTTQPPALAGLQHLRKYPCADYAGMTEVIQAYLQSLPNGAVPDKLCVCVAGAVTADEVFMPNRGWTFSQRAVRETLDLDVHFINDFTAQVHSIVTLESGEIEWLGEPRPLGNGAFVVLGPGTGLGVGAMTAGGEVMPSEGGHCSFSPQNPRQLQLLEVLWQLLPRVDIERLVSGPGLENLYQAHTRMRSREATLDAPAIAQAADAGDDVARTVVQDFFDILASYASDVAMLMAAVDGVYVVGDLMPRLRALNDVTRFRDCFNAKENYQEFCSRIPLALVDAQDTGLRGCWRYLQVS